jgi:RNA ligase (TIGR02306 family)
MSKLAYIETIHSIQPHPNPEVLRLECGKIHEWPVVIPKGEYKNGDLVVFIEIDSIVPNTDIFKFMERQKFRVWNAKFKGSPSSGLVMPLSILPKDKLGVDLHNGYDLTELLGILKYERQESFVNNGETKGGFPSNLISISDELNLLSYPEALSELDGKECIISQKKDGSSTTFIYNTGEFDACSRRLKLKENEGFPYQMVNQYDIKNKLINLNKNIAIQAETIGTGMNGNRMGLKNRQIRVFRIKNLDTRTLYTWDELVELSNQLELPTVPLLERFIFDKNIHTVEYFRNLADKQLYPNGKAGEGIVISPVIPFYSNVLDKFWSLKIINQNYKQE